MRAGTTWSEYLTSFHSDRAGITEDVLAAATAGGVTPYEWLCEPLREVSSLVLDIACGSGPMRRPLGDVDWVGIDMSANELGRAALGGTGPLVQADAARLPIATAAVGAAVCSMALMLVEPFDAVLSEVARVLAPGGVFVATIPVERPLRMSDRLRYLRLFAALRVARLDYPNRAELTDPRERLARHGLVVVSDERRRFSYAIADSAAAETLVRSLYLPGVADDRVDTGVRVARRWRCDIGLPLRRIICRRATPA
ncbi:MAG: class I SAM-dependent methyltransferase [Actinobacteria bacterium]|nr:class I SAM-dependent methyltransferase [Actinomycetota bacterium]